MPLITKVRKNIKELQIYSYFRQNKTKYQSIKTDRFFSQLCTSCCYNLGNLYTHMRRHTGQLFRCSKCAFSTCNKSHLVEHLKTHTRSKQTCRLCNKEYTTEKSLINHIRKYHKGEKGEWDYQLTPSRITVITRAYAAPEHKPHPQH